jgi:multimeric flavodoxin WrbA
MRKGLFLLAILAFAVAAPVYAANVTGTWTLTMSNPMGQEETFDLDIKDNGGSLVVTGTHPQLSGLEGTGALKGDVVTMDVTATGPMAVQLIFEGKVSGNEMEGTRKIEMAAGGGGQGGAPGGGEGGAPPGGGEGGAPAGGGQGGAPGGGQGGGPGGAPGGGGDASDAWSAVKK